MRYSQEQQEKYPQQDMDELLIQFAAETLTRVAYEKLAYEGASDAQEAQEARVDRAVEAARVLSDAGLLAWPDDTSVVEVSWFIDLAAPQTHGLPELEEMMTFARDAKAALAYADACRLTGRPHRLYWSWTLRGHGGNTRVEVGER